MSIASIVDDKDFLAHEVFHSAGHLAAGCPIATIAVDPDIDLDDGLGDGAIASYMPPEGGITKHGEMFSLLCGVMGSILTSPMFKKIDRVLILQAPLQMAQALLPLVNTHDDDLRRIQASEIDKVEMNIIARTAALFASWICATGEMDRVVKTCRNLNVDDAAIVFRNDEVLFTSLSSNVDLFLQMASLPVFGDKNSVRRMFDSMGDYPAPPLADALLDGRIPHDKTAELPLGQVVQ